MRSSAGKSSNSLHYLTSGLLYAFFAIFLIYPIYRVVISGFLSKGNFTLAYFSLIFRDPVLLQGLLNATWIAITVTVAALLVSLPLAILSVRYEFPGRGILSGLLLAPLVLPPFVGAMGVRLILGRLGPLSVFFHAGPEGFDWLGRFRVIGIIVVETFHLYPVLLLNLQASLANVDPAMEQAAANLGADRWTIFRKITLPLIRPGLFAGCTLTLIWSFSELGTPLMFDYRTITPVQIFRMLTEVSGNPLPFALVIVTLTVSTVLYAAGKLVLGTGHEAATTKAATSWSPRRLTGFASLGAIVLFILVLIVGLMPDISVILTSLTATGQWYRSILPTEFTLNHFSDAMVNDLALPSVQNSVKYAIAATLLALIVGIAVSIIVVRSRVPGRWLMDALAMLPLAVPGLVLAFGYLAISVSLKHKYLDRLPSWLDVLQNPTFFLVVAYAARRLPYVVRSVSAGLQQTPRDLELAGANLGASRLTVLTKITLPLIAANLIAGGLLAFAFTLLEVSDSLVLAQKAAYFPITRAILELASRLGDGLYIASALGVWAMLLLTVTLLAANALLGRRLGAIFRM